MAECSAQEVQHGRGVLPGVEGPPDRGDGEPVDGGRALAFGVGHRQELFAQFRSQVARRHRGQVGLQQDMVQRRGQVLAQDAQGVVRLLGGDRRAELAQGPGADQAQHLGFGEDAPDQGAEAPGHPGLRPVGPLQHGGGIQDRRLCRRPPRPPG